MGPIAFALLLLTQSTVAGAPGGTAAQKQAVERLEERWLVHENDPAFLEDLLAGDFVHVLPQGLVTQREQLAFMRAHPAPGDGTARRFESLQVRIFGTAAVATGIVAATPPDGKVRRTAFTDVFAFRDGRWRAVNAQETPLQASPASR